MNLSQPFSNKFPAQRVGMENEPRLRIALKNSWIPGPGIKPKCSWPTLSIES